MSFTAVKELYDKVERGFGKTEAMTKTMDLSPNLSKIHTPIKPM